MAKKINDISKSDRIDAIKDVLNRWGKLDKDLLDHHVSLKLNVEKESIKKSLYRDLEQLTDNRILEKEYFTRDGILIEEYDPDLHKNFMCKWSLFDSDYKIIGQKIIEDFGGKIFCSKLINLDVSISENEGSMSLKSRHLFFVLGDQFVKIAIHKDAIPVSVLILRNENQFTPDFKNIVEEKIGKRLLILKLPEASISRFKGAEQLGHCLLKLGEEKDEIIDLKSSNRSFITKISNKEIDELLKFGRSLSSSTIDIDWESKYKNKSDEIIVEYSSFCEPGYFLRVGKRFGILVI